MKTKLYPLILLLAVAMLAAAQFSSAQDTLTTDGFEGSGSGSFGNWTAASNAFLKNDAALATTGSFSAELYSGGNITTTNPLPLGSSGYTSVTISISAKWLNGSTTRRFSVRYAADGVNFVEIANADIGDTNATTAQTPTTVTLTEGGGITATNVNAINSAGYSGAPFTDQGRFQIFYSSNSTTHRVYLDDISITANPTFTGKYWDTDGATAGAGGATPGGTWGIDDFWSSASDGTAATGAWTPGAPAVFAAGSDATGTYTVTVDGTQDIGGLSFQEGSVTLTGGTALRMTSDASAYVVSGLSATVATSLSDDGTSWTLSKDGPGTLALTGNNSGATGAMILNGGITEFGVPASINGTGETLTVNDDAVLSFSSGFGAANIPAALDRVVTTSTGVIAADNYASADFDFDTAGLTGAYFGAIGNVGYTGTLTPNGTAYRLGGGGGTLSLPGSLTPSYTLDVKAPGIVQLNGFSSSIGGLSNNGAAVLENGSATTDMTLTVNNASTNTYNGILQDGGAATLALTKEGSGTLILNGANNYTGDTTISGGTLQIGTNNSANGAVIGGGNYAGDISIASGSILSIQSNAAQELSGVISGAGDVIKSYNGTLTLSGDNIYTGKTILRPLSTAGFGTVVVSSFNSVNGGTPLMATSSFGAPTTVANGTIDFGSTGAQAGGTIRYIGPGETTDRVLNFLMNGNGGGKTLDASGSGLLKFTSPVTKSGSNSNDLILTGTGDGEIVGGLPFVARNFTKSGTGTWTLGGSSGWTGTTTISGGTLVMNDASVIPGGIDSAGGTSCLILNGGVVGLGAGDFSRPLGSNATVTAVNFTGNGGWAAYGADRIVNLGGAAATVAWGTANTGLNGKVLILGATTATHMVTLQNPLDLAGSTRTVQVDDGAAVVDATLSGIISGANALNKNGDGTLALSGDNSYTGTTTINAGTLLVNGDQTSATGLLDVKSGKTLGGTGTIGGNVTVENTAGLTFDLITAPGSHDKLDVMGSFTFESASVLTITSSGGTPSTGIYTLVTAGSFPPGDVPATVNLPAGWTADDPEIVGNDLVINITSTGSAATPYETWAATFLPADVSDPQGDNDSDGLKNIQEFAFGTDPTASTGAITIDGGGNVTNAKGTPTAYLNGITETGVDFRAIFSRRKDHVTAGLVYTVQFSTELDEWVNYAFAPGEPILLDGSDPEIDVVYVPFPLAVETSNGFEKPQFVRVGIEFAP